MKLNELITQFTIAVSNEEQACLDKLQTLTPLSALSAREQHVVQQLVRKSLVIRVRHNGITGVIANEPSR
jgi:hypothetical protein